MLQSGLQELTRDTRSWVSLGVVTAVEEHAAWGYLASVTLHPSGREIQARIVGWGPVYVPVVVDQEVAVIFPDGDANGALILPGLPSQAAPVPSNWSNASVRVEAGDVPLELAAGVSASRVQLVLGTDGSCTISAPGGVKLQGSGTATQALILGTSFAPALAGAMAEVAALAAAGAGGPIPTTTQFLLNLLSGSYTSTVSRTQ